MAGRRTAAAWTATALLGLVGGCATTGGKSEPVAIKSISTSRTGKTAEQLEQELIDFANLYAALTMQAHDSILESDPSPAVRARVHDAKLMRISTALLIATGANPGGNLLDMVVFVTLVADKDAEYWVPRLRAEHGVETATVLLTLGEQLKADIWELATEVLSREQLDELRQLIAAWQAGNPDVHYVGVVSFREFAEQRTASRAGGGDPGLFADVTRATRAIDETRLLAERAMLRASAMPHLLRWEAQALLYDLALEPEFQRLQIDLDTFAETTGRITTAVEALPAQITAERKATIEQVSGKVAEEREASLTRIAELVAAERQATVDHVMRRLDEQRESFFQDIETESGELQALLTETRLTMASGQELLATINATLGAADALATRFDDPDRADGPDEPMSLAEARQVAESVTAAADHIHQVVLSAENLLESPAWDERVPQLAGVVDLGSSRLLLRVFWLTVGLIAIFLVSAIGARLVYHYLALRIFGDLARPAGQRQDR